jgi:hypothetical protein
MLEEHWKKEIDIVTEKFIESFGSFTESQLNYKPDPTGWSVAQNISHLILLNNSYFHNFDEIKKGKHDLPQGDAMEELVANSLQTLLPYTSEDRPKRANTWNMWQPSPEPFSLKIVDDFINHQSVFKLHIVELQAFFLTPTFIKYPGESALVFRLQDCIDFLIEHENRHWIQAHEVNTIV